MTRQERKLLAERGYIQAPSWVWRVQCWTQNGKLDLQMYFRRMKEAEKYKKLSEDEGYIVFVRRLTRYESMQIDMINVNGRVIK